MTDHDLCGLPTSLTTCTVFIVIPSLYTIPGKNSFSSILLLPWYNLHWSQFEACKQYIKLDLAKSLINYSRLIFFCPTEEIMTT